MLAGIRVLDATGPLGWLAGRLLADLGAEVEKVEAPDADLSAADWRALNINKRLLRIARATQEGLAPFDAHAAAADILFVTPAPGETDAAAVAARHPRLIVVAITPFGLSGPKAGWMASDIEIMAAGGAMSLAGEPGGEPMRVSAPQSGAWAGAMAAVGALTALAARQRTGRGQLVDVSAQAAVITALAHAPTFYDLLGVNATRAGAYMTGRSVKGARYRVFWPCRDGHLNFILYGGSAGRRTNESLVAWMRESGAALGTLAAIDWARFDPTGATQEEVDALEAPIAQFFLSVTKRQFLEEAHSREMLGYPVSTVADIATDPQLAARGFWQDIEVEGQRERHCGSFVIVDGARPRVQPGGNIPDASSRQISTATTAPGNEARPAPALAGLKVVEFGSYAAGPHAGKLLANFGATVVHVESMSRPDGFRLQYPPYKDGKPGLNSSGCFAIFNDSKLGISVDLKNSAGLAEAKRLCAWADVVIENMRPGVMARLGLGYDELQKTNPGLVMLSTCNMGQTGPRADTPGFGSQLSALAGFCGLTGKAEGPPMLLYGPYIDFIASILGAAAILAALERRRHTGRGAWLDVSQYECGLLFIAGPLLDYHAQGLIAQRRGNSDASALLHGAYPCADEGWVAISCWSEGELARLARAIGQEGAHAALEAWTRARGAQDAAATLQVAGVHAHAVNTMADLFSDPQLAARRIWRHRAHAVIGEHAYLFPAFDLAETPGDVTGPAPCLGADTERVFRDFLGMTAQDYEAAQARGAFA